MVIEKELPSGILNLVKRDSIGFSGSSRFTPLMLGSFSGRFGVTRALLELLEVEEHIDRS